VRGISLKLIGLVVPVIVSLASGTTHADFAPIFDGGVGQSRYIPYLQRPTADSIRVLWFSSENEPGTLEVTGKRTRVVVRSVPIKASAISAGWSKTYAPKELPRRYLHEVTATGLRPDTVYAYKVVHGRDQFDATCRTAPGPDTRRSLRIIAFADSETEPATRRETVRGQPYPLTHDEAFATNLKAVRARHPDLLVIAGDLVQHGGEQEDWERFFAHVNRGPAGTSLASRVPIVAALGNHEYYGPTYAQPGSEHAVAKFLTYFSNPSNMSPVKAQEERYYRLDYGPVTLIVLDCNNGPDHDPARDTNQCGLVGEDSPGGVAPNWCPGSRQYRWLQSQLSQALRHMAFTFVVMHYCPYSSGVHGLPPGATGEKGRNCLSGMPLRELDTLFHRYGVDLVLAGHDEMLELSATHTAKPAHTVHYWDIGIAGDGLRSPHPAARNPARIFLADHSAQGKHYGFLQIDLKHEAGGWVCEVQPFWINPTTREVGGAYGVRLRVRGRPLGTK